MALLSSRGTVGDEVFGLIKQIGLNPRIVNAFYPWGGGFNIFFESKDQVVEAWQKSGEASDEIHAHLTEKNRTLENKIKELEDTNHELKEQLEFFEVKFEDAAKEKDKAMYNFDQIQDELQGVLKATKEMENQYQLHHNPLNFNAENTAKEIIQLKEKLNILNGELLISQDDNTQQKENHEAQRKERERLLQSANGKLKASDERLKSMSIDLTKANDLVLINDAASKELKKESDGKITSMKIALSEAKLSNQISNNASALNEVENSNTTQTEPMSRIIEGDSAFIKRMQDE